MLLCTCMEGSLCELTVKGIDAYTFYSLSYVILLCCTRSPKQVWQSDQTRSMNRKAIDRQVCIWSKLYVSWMWTHRLGRRKCNDNDFLYPRFSIHQVHKWALKMASWRRCLVLLLLSFLFLEWGGIQQKGGKNMVAIWDKDGWKRKEKEKNYART